MISQRYEEQVKLLIKCLPAIFQESCFAIKGGTAINLFYFNLPRLSVDIDLVYLPIEDMSTTYAKIHDALERIAIRLKKMNFSIYVSKNETRKLICSNQSAQIKIEPNYTLRGAIFPVREASLCEKAQEQYGYARARLISDAELWGGKICAALDRQHPRDLFDIAQFFTLQDITTEIKQGFLSLLLASNRPIHEILNPNFTMSERVFNDEFYGMTNLPFDFCKAREAFHQLVKQISACLTDIDREELLRFVALEQPVTDLFVTQLCNLPGVRWKLKNLDALRARNPVKFQEQYTQLLSLFK